jgi:hypothetical protein
LNIIQYKEKGGMTCDVPELGLGVEEYVWPAFVLCTGLGLWGGSETTGCSTGVSGRQAHADARMYVLLILQALQ